MQCRARTLDGGHPGRVIATAQPLILPDTRDHPAFTQYLRTSRMGSAVCTPLVWNGAAQGLIIVASQACGTMRLADPGILVVLARVVRQRWLATGGADWLAGD